MKFGRIKAKQKIWREEWRGKNQEKSCFEFAHIYWFTDPTFPSVRKEKRVNFTKIMARFIWNLHGEKALSKSNQLM